MLCWFIVIVNYIIYLSFKYEIMLNNKILRAKTAYIIKAVVLISLFFASGRTNVFGYTPDNWVVYLNNPDWEIPFNFLYSNDDGIKPILYVSTSGNHVNHPWFGTAITPTIDYAQEKIILPELNKGLYVFYVYYLHDDGFIEDLAVFVVVTESDIIDVNNCCPEDCNLVCQSDFENYTINEPIRTYDVLGKIFTNGQTAPFKFNNYSSLGVYEGSSNNAYISSDGHQRMLFLPDRFGVPHPVVSPKGGNRDEYVEYEQGNESGYIIKLRDPIGVDESVQITFDATIFGGNANSELSEANLYGHVRLFAMENDFSSFSVNNIEYPYTTLFDPFTFDLSGTKGYYIESGLETDYFGIPIPRESVYDWAPWINMAQNHYPVGVGGIDDFQHINFMWTNNTTKAITAIMIVGDGFSPIISEISNSDDDMSAELVDPKWYIVGVNNFEVTKKSKHIPICVTGDESEICLGNCTHLIEYKVCWCGEPTEKSEPITFEVSVDDIYSGVDVILPSGSFNSDGIATVTLDEPGDCVNLTFEVSIDISVGPGNIELPLNFSGGGGACEMCEEGAYIQSYTPSIIEMVDCNFTCTCSELNNIGAKNSTTYWSSLTNTQKEKTCYAVEGTLVIDENITFTAKQFIMNDDAKIHIPDKVVSFIGCELKGCELLWTGIELIHTNAYLNVYGNTVIKDAKTAISRRRYNATLNVSGAIFVNNYIGVVLGQDVLTPSAANTPARIVNNIFKSTKLLPATNLDTKDKIGYAGITIYKANENIGRVSVSPSNYFTNLANGILIDESTTGITNNHFEAISEKPYYNSGSNVSGYGIRHNTSSAHTLYVGGSLDESFPNSTNVFEYVNRAIQGNGIMHIYRTKMEYVNYGIDLRARAGSAIYSSVNDMSVVRRGYMLTVDNSDARGAIAFNTIDFVTPASSSIGIAINMQNIKSSTADLIIANNDITGVPRIGMYINNLVDAEIHGNRITSSEPNFNGIYMTGADEVRVYENAIYNTIPGTGSVGVYLSRFTNSDLVCNYIGNTGTGIKLGNLNTTSDMKTNLLEGITSLGFHMQKGSTLEAKSNGGVHIGAGNRWESLDMGAVTAKHEGTEDQIKKSRFITHYDLLPLFPEGYIAANENPTNPWFTYVPGGFDEECNTTPIPVSPTNLDYLIDLAQDSIDFAVYDEQLKAQGRHQVFELMNRYPGLGYSIDMEGFYDDYLLTDAGKVYDLRRRLVEALIMPDSTVAAIDSLNWEITMFMVEIQAYQDSLSLTPTVGDLATYYSNVNALSAGINSIRAEIKARRDGFRDELEDELNLIIYEFSLISAPTDVTTYNAWIETQIEADYLVSGLPQLTGMELGILLAIAAQCPDYGGKAVYWSRSLVNKEYPFLTWNDDNLCQDTLGANLVEQDPHFRRTASDTIGMTISPNPSTGVVTIRGAELEGGGRIIVTDITGKRLVSATYKPGMQLDLSLWPGLVYVGVYDGTGRLVYMGKQVIIR